MLLKCLLILVISCNQIAPSHQASTVSSSKTDDPIDKATSSAPPINANTGTTVNAPTSTEEVITTTERQTHVILGDSCTNVTDCEVAISGAVTCMQTCQCDNSSHFEFNQTTCLEDSRLTPIIHLDASVYQINISVSHSNISTENLTLSYNVTATSANTSTTICHEDSNPTVCDALDPGTVYNISVAVLMMDRIIAQNSTSEATVPAIPGEINVTQSNLTGPNITLVWGQSEGLVEYYSITVTSPGSTYNSSSNMVDIYKLEDGQSYNVSIVAVSHGKTSTTRSGSFKTEVQVPDPPVNVTVTMVTLTHNSLTLQWNRPKEVRGTLQSYEICWQSKVYIDETYHPQNCTNTTAGLTNKSAVYNFTDLMAGTFYKFAIFTINEEYISQENASVETRTNETEPGTVESLTVTSKNDTLNVTWSRPSQPNGDIVSYVLEWIKTGSKSGNSCEVLFTNSSSDPIQLSSLDEEDCPNETVSVAINQHSMQYIIEGLAAFTNYTVSVVAYTKVGPGPKSNTTQQTSLLKPDEVTNVKAAVINSTAVNVSWTIPDKNPGLINYTLEIFDVVFNKPSNVTPCFTTDYSSAECIQDGLHPFWKYSFKVMSSNPAGESVSSDTDVVITHESNPGSVEQVSIALFKDKPCDATKVKVNWTEPKLLDRMANITLYQISDNMGKLLQNIQSQSADPWESSPKNHTVTVSEKVSPETQFSWQIKAVSSTSLQGTSSNFSFNTENCKPPDWDRSKKISVSQTSLNGIRISVDLKFFNDETQGAIKERGFIVSRSEISDPTGTSLQGIGGWKTSSLKYRIVLDDLKIDTQSAQVMNMRSNQPVEIKIGSEDCKASTNTYCNKYLPQDTQIYLIGYVCTDGFKCSFTPLFGPFRTAKPEEKGGIQPAIIVSITILSILVLAVALFAVLWCRGAIDPPGWFMKNEEVESQPISPLSPTISRKRPFEVSKFEEVLEDLHRDTNLKLSDQYEDIAKMSKEIAERSTCNNANIEANKPKNRWVNILPYDHSRVKLQQLDDDDPTSDYINANYMPGFNNQREYIASQGPLPGTVDDFWRMVWEQNVKVIVMLTQCREGNRVKCEMYWPDQLREPKQYGDIVVNPISISPLDKYIISIFKVIANGQERQVTHLHYLDFPDFSANVEYDHFLDFVKTARSLIPHDNDGPIIVHCSAGVGRTGTFIALDRLQMFLNSPNFSWDSTVDVFDIVLSLRENRVLMVQTESQYVLIHDCFMKMLEAKRLSEMKTYSDDNLYANEGFDPYPEVLYENINGADMTQNMKTEL